MNDKWWPFSVMNDIVNDKKGHNIKNDSFAHKPVGLLVYNVTIPLPGTMIGLLDGR